MSMPTYPYKNEFAKKKRPSNYLFRHAARKKINKTHRALWEGSPNDNKPRSLFSNLIDRFWTQPCQTVPNGTGDQNQMDSKRPDLGTAGTWDWAARIGMTYWAWDDLDLGRLGLGATWTWDVPGPEKTHRPFWRRDAETWLEPGSDWLGFASDLARI